MVVSGKVVQWRGECGGFQKVFGGVGEVLFCLESANGCDDYDDGLGSPANHAFPSCNWRYVRYLFDKTTLTNEVPYSGMQHIIYIINNQHW